jgi:hypothetical protein
MNLKRLLGTTAVAATFLCAGAANAELYQFTLSGDFSASWQLDSEAIPDLVIDGVVIGYLDIAGTYANAVSNVADIYFFPASNGGGLFIDDYVGEQTLLSTYGPEIYTGSPESPVFVPGTYALTDVNDVGSYTLTISPVPEPATYAMLLGGLVLTGAALRRRYDK